MHQSLFGLLMSMLYPTSMVVYANDGTPENTEGEAVESAQVDTNTSSERTLENGQDFVTSARSQSSDCSPDEEECTVQSDSEGGEAEPEPDETIPVDTEVEETEELEVTEGEAPAPIESEETNVVADAEIEESGDNPAPETVETVEEIENSDEIEIDPEDNTSEPDVESEEIEEVETVVVIDQANEATEDAEIEEQPEETAALEADIAEDTDSQVATPEEAVDNSVDDAETVEDNGVAEAAEVPGDEDANKAGGDAVEADESVGEISEEVVEQVTETMGEVEDLSEDVDNSNENKMVSEVAFEMDGTEIEAAPLPDLGLNCSSTSNTEESFDLTSCEGEDESLATSEINSLAHKDANGAANGAQIVVVQAQGGVVFTPTYLDVVNDTNIGFDHNTLGVTRQNAFANALGIVGGWFDHISLVTLEVQNSATTLDGTLAFAGSGPIGTNNGFHKTVVQEKIQNGIDANGADPDGNVTINFPVDDPGNNCPNDPGCFDWDYDDNVANDLYDFVSTVIHEVAHALGFLSAINQNGEGFYEISGDSDAWFEFDDFVSDKNGNDLVNDNTFAFDTSKNGVLTGGVNDGMFFSGQNANAANGGNPIHIYSPDPWQGGSSGSHLDDDFYSSTQLLMEAATGPGNSARTLSEVEKCIFVDLGYDVVGAQCGNANGVAGDGNTNGVAGGGTNGVADDSTSELPTQLISNSNLNVSKDAAGNLSFYSPVGSVFLGQLTQAQWSGAAPGTVLINTVYTDLGILLYVTVLPSGQLQVQVYSLADGALLSTTTITP